MLSNRLPLVFIGIFISVFIVSCAASEANIAPVKAQKILAEKDYKALKDKKTLMLRYNPAPCDCTAYEVRAPDGWRRAILIFDSKEQKQLIEKPLRAGFVNGIPHAVRIKALVDSVLRLKCGEWGLKVEVQEVNHETD